jgi:ABC-2 type transport system permease protein
MKLLRDTWLIFQRQMLLVLRSPVWLIVGVVQPSLYLLLFGPLLKSALHARSTAEVYQSFVPGLLVMLAIFGTFFVGFTLIAEVRAGVIERSRVTPVSRLALLLGRSLRDVMSLLFQAGVITVLSIPFGLVVRAGDVVLAYLLLGLIALMMSALSYGAALKLRSESTLGPLLNLVGQPIVLLSGILLPISVSTAPGWLLGISRWNPMSWAVDAVRALFAGHPGDRSVWIALLILGSLTVVTVTWTARSFARSVR